jgi:RHS repeat-associated protein
MTILYDASGKKHGQISAEGNYGYLGGVVTKDGALEGMYFAHGRVVPDAESENEYRFEYAIQDHLGNNRVFFSDKNHDGILQKPEEILKESHYYPFGMNMDGDWGGSMRSPEGFGPEYVNRFNYNGKELTDELGIDMYDYGARWYDASIGRWNAVDPLAESMPNWSTYNYAFSNPISYIDPDGMAPQWVPSMNDKGDLVLTAEQGDNLETLVQFFGSEENASKYLPNYALNSNLNIQEGSTIKLKNNVFSKASKDFAKNFINEDNSSEMSYNCHTSCVLGTQGIDFSNRRWEEGNLGERGRDLILMEKYEPALPGSQEFGSTIITFDRDHSAIYFGRSQDGTGYVWEKPNFVDGPQISKIKEVSKRTGGIRPSNAFGNQKFGLYNLRGN